MDMVEAIGLICLEYDRAARKFPPFNGPHEGYAVILEEMDELWDEIKKVKADHTNKECLVKEAKQLGAMTLRFMVDVID